MGVNNCNINQVNSNPQNFPKKLDTASELVGFDIDKYVFEDTFEKGSNPQIAYDPIREHDVFLRTPSPAVTKDNSSSGLFLLSLLSLGAALAVKFGAKKP